MVIYINALQEIIIEDFIYSQLVTEHILLVTELVTEQILQVN